MGVFDVIMSFLWAVAEKSDKVYKDTISSEKKRLEGIAKYSSHKEERDRATVLLSKLNGENKE